MARKVLDDYYISASKIADKWNENEMEDSKEWTGEQISTQFRRILDKMTEDGLKHIEDKVNTIRSKYKSESKSKQNINKWIFFDSSEIYEINKEREAIDIPEKGSLSKYLKLVEKGMKLSRDFEMYKADAYGTMKELFALWNNFKDGCSTSQEKEKFLNDLLCLVPWDQDLDDLIKKLYVIETKEDEKRTVRREIIKRVEEKRLLIRDLVENFWKDNQDERFYEKRLLIGKQFPEQYVLLKKWEKKWINVMDKVNDIRKMEQSIKEDAGRVQRTTGFDISELIRCSLMLYYSDMWDKNIECKYETIKQDVEGYIEKCKNCVRDFVQHDTLEKGRDYYYIKEKAFQELEEMYDLLNEAFKKMDIIMKCCKQERCKQNVETDHCKAAETYEELLDLQSESSNVFVIYDILEMFQHFTTFCFF